MGLLLICPRCQGKGPLNSRACERCGADLRDLPLEERRYFISRPPETGAAAPEAGPRAAPGPLEVEVVQPFPQETRTGNYRPETQEVSLCEALDRILNKGAVLFGEVMISVANIDLIYLGLQVIVASMETARELKGPRGRSSFGENLIDRGVCS